MKSKKVNPLHIKNMVCNRCITAVRQILDEEKIDYTTVNLGEVILTKNLSEQQTAPLKARLTAAGFELLDDAKSKLIEKIKTIIIESVHYNETDKKYNLSAWLSAKLHRDYSYLSHLFSDVEGITIEKYAILQKIEKIKELLAYGELSLNEISFQLGYSSAAHLSAQFKKITGLTPSYFKQNHQHTRTPLDKV